MVVVPIALFLQGLGLPLPYVSEWDIWKAVVSRLAAWPPWSITAALAGHLAIISYGCNDVMHAQWPIGRALISMRR